MGCVLGNRYGVALIRPQAPLTFPFPSEHFSSRDSLILIPEPEPEPEPEPVAIEINFHAMSERPPPPAGSQFLDMYAEGAQVHYYRSGTTPLQATMMMWQFVLTGATVAGKWRQGQIRKAESSGKRYVVSGSLAGGFFRYFTCAHLGHQILDLQNQETYHADIGKIATA